MEACTVVGEWTELVMERWSWWVVTGGVCVAGYYGVDTMEYVGDILLLYMVVDTGGGGGGTNRCVDECRWGVIT